MNVSPVSLTVPQRAADSSSRSALSSAASRSLLQWLDYQRVWWRAARVWLGFVLLGGGFAVWWATFAFPSTWGWRL